MLAPDALYIFELALKHGQPLEKLISDVIRGTKALITMRIAARAATSPETLSEIEEG